MSITALKQALEALESVTGHFTRTPSTLRDSEVRGEAHKAIAALRQAIEQAEKAEPVAWQHHAKKLTQWLYCMSYNDSYFGEPAGLVKQVTGELDRLIGTHPAQKQAEKADVELCSTQSKETFDQPVGYWQGEFSKDGGATLYEVPQESYFGYTYRNTPLYTHPAREPLTDEELKHIQDANWVECEGGGYDWNTFSFARAIEAAHGIGEQK